jgi:hypothetical protein
MSCCGGKVYNPSSSQMKCCAGTLYDLQVQGRLSGEAQCCGSVLMEAGSTQTCCSAPGLDLLYPTQPGFTCCGHRYPNASLWSCCAGVLHPRPEPHNTTKNVIPGQWEQDTIDLWFMPQLELRLFISERSLKDQPTSQTSDMNIEFYI